MKRCMKILGTRLLDGEKVKIDLIMTSIEKQAVGYICMISTHQKRSKKFILNGNRHVLEQDYMFDVTLDIL